MGNDAPLPATGRLTYVLVRTGDEWRIASAQTTPSTSAGVGLIWGLPDLI